MEGELTIIDNLSGSVFHHYSSPAGCRSGHDKQEVSWCLRGAGLGESPALGGYCPDSRWPASRDTWSVGQQVDRLWSSRLPATPLPLTQPGPGSSLAVTPLCLPTPPPPRLGLLPRWTCHPRSTDLRTSLTAILCPSGEPALPVPTPWVTRGYPLSLQVQLAETEAFSLNSDKSSSILLGDDLSLEDPTACPLRPKDSKVSSPVGSCTASLSLQAGLRPLSQDTASSQCPLWAVPAVDQALGSCWSDEGSGVQRGGEIYLKSHSNKFSQDPKHSCHRPQLLLVALDTMYPSKRTLRCPRGPQCPEESEL